jgi:hypothetical protein
MTKMARFMAALMAANTKQIGQNTTSTKVKTTL